MWEILLCGSVNEIGRQDSVANSILLLYHNGHFSSYFHNLRSWENIGRYMKPEMAPLWSRAVDLSNSKVLVSARKVALYTPEIEKM